MNRLILFACMFFGSVWSAEQTLTFVTEPFPPFNYEKNGEVISPIKEIITTVCEEMNVECRFSIRPWRRALGLAKLGEVNGLFSIGKNPDREKWMYFSLPVVKTGYGLFVQKNSDLNFKTLKDLEGYTILVYAPSHLSRRVESFAPQIPNVKVQKELANEIALKKINEYFYGVKSALFINRVTGNFLIKNLNFNNVRYAGDEDSVLYYIGFPKISNNESTVIEFNQYLMKLYKEGKIQEILKKYDMEAPDLSELTQE